MREKKYIGGFSSIPYRNGKRANSGFKGRAALFFAVMGPGVITAFADNDAGGIATYIIAGAKYGYSLLFVLLVSTVCLAVAQEISARTGVVTGKGLFELIRERYGRRASIWIMLSLLIANFGTTVSEFSGIAVGFDIFEVDKFVAVPLAAFVVWFLVVKANYNYVEKVFFLLCATFIGYIISGIMVDPPWREVFCAAVTPSLSGDRGFLVMAMGIVGTTITPWGQFYIQASVVDKGLGAKDYAYTLVDVLVGTFFTGLVAFFVIIATAAAMYGAPYEPEHMKEAAAALVPLAGGYAKWLFAVGLIGASMLAAIILPLSTAYAICEALGCKNGISKTYKEAPVFFIIYTGLIFAGAAVVLAPFSLYHLMLATQVLNGVLLPPILIFMLLIAGDEELMGKYKNPRFYHGVAWLFTAGIIVLTVVLLAATIAPDWFA